MFKEININNIKGINESIETSFILVKVNNEIITGFVNCIITPKYRNNEYVLILSDCNNTFIGNIKLVNNVSVSYE